jgi:hypothetical protein
MMPPSPVLALVLLCALLPFLLLACLRIGLWALTPTQRLEPFAETQARILSPGLTLLRIRVLLATNGAISLQAVTLPILLSRLRRANEPREELTRPQAEALHEGCIVHTLSPREKRERLCRERRYRGGPQVATVETSGRRARQKHMPRWHHEAALSDLRQGLPMGFLIHGAEVHAIDKQGVIPVTDHVMGQARDRFEQ